MPKYSDFAAAIFDVDDTLISNFPPDYPMGLHEESRLQAVHQVGRTHGIPALAHFGAQDNHDAFKNASVHSMEGATWAILQKAGLAGSDSINYADPFLLEIVKIKDKLHKDVLLAHGREVPGAAAFVRALAAHGFQGKMAVASTGSRRDILLSLEIIGVAGLFPDKQIVTKESFFEHPKPHPMAFDLAFKSLGLPTDTPRTKVIAFEDDPRGIMSAKAAGLYVCGITTRYTKAELAGQPVAPDLICDSYEEIAVALGL
ncbi:MAG TPA: HAD family phosphatase [Candidatus Saccharimonadales bacterium]|nr:HAD family phosphatase [Candidatus Saccharimonadales bacterium]